MRKPVRLETAFVMHHGALLPMKSGVLGNHRFFIKSAEKKTGESKKEAKKSKRRNPSD